MVTEKCPYEEIPRTSQFTFGRLAPVQLSSEVEDVTLCADCRLTIRFAGAGDERDDQASSGTTAPRPYIRAHLTPFPSPPQPNKHLALCPCYTK